jgi:hypothetical protein
MRMTSKREVPLHGDVDAIPWVSLCSAAIVSDLQFTDGYCARLESMDTRDQVYHRSSTRIESIGECIWIASTWSLESRVLI